MRLSRFLASINRSASALFGFCLVFATLTYPSESCPEDVEECKEHLGALRKRLQRRYGAFPAVWRIGIQQRGTWHFHLLLFMPPGYGSLNELRAFIARSWFEICGEVSEGHLLAGTNVSRVKRWREGTSPAEKYVARPEEALNGLPTGRVWGVWHRELLPVSWETVEVPVAVARKVARAFARLARRRVPGRPSYSMTVFVRHSDVRRLLAFLGHDID